MLEQWLRTYSWLHVKFVPFRRRLLPSPTFLASWAQGADVVRSPPLSLSLSPGWMGLNAICNLPKGPGGTHWLLLRSINSNGNQLSACQEARPSGSTPACQGGARRLVVQLRGGDHRTAAPSPALCMPRSPLPLRGLPPRCRLSPACRGGLRGSGDDCRATRGGTTIRPEASSLPGGGSSPSPPSK